jgi:hypothetical protein
MERARKKAGIVARLSFYRVRDGSEFVADLHPEHPRADGYFGLDELGR